MAKGDFRVLDSDMHILEPADLWQRYIDSRFKHLAPIGTTDHVRDLRLVGPDGKAWGRPVDPPPGTLPPPGHVFIRMKNCSNLTTSVAGRRKCNWMPWP